MLFAARGISLLSPLFSAGAHERRHGKNAGFCPRCLGVADLFPRRFHGIATTDEFVPSLLMARYAVQTPKLCPNNAEALPKQRRRIKARKETRPAMGNGPPCV